MPFTMRAGGDMECVIIGVIGVSVVLFGMLLYATEPVAEDKKVDKGEEWRWCGTVYYGYQCPRCLKRFHRQMPRCPYCKKSLKNFSGMKFYKLSEENW